ncbi:MAG: protoporphyrinogen/coproporphyrinogen oxidase [Myxococcaceae bacterium]
MPDQDIVVVGAGISGLSFAYHAARAGRSVRVLEKGARAGGCIQSQRVDGGFWFELGAHTCYNSYQALLAMLEERGALGELLAREKAPFRLLRDGQIRKITQELALFELLTSAPRLLTSKKQGKSVREYYGRIVGAGNYARVFGPLFAAVPSQPADDFPAEMLFKSRTRRKDVPRSFTLKGGLSSAIEAIATVPGVTVETSAGVGAIEREGGGFVVRAGEASYRARQVVLAVPPPAGASLLRAVLPEVARALDSMKAATVETVGVVVRKGALALERVAGIIPLDGRFFSAVSRDVVSDPGYRGFSFHFKPGATLEARLSIVSEVLKVERKKLEHLAERQVVLPSPVVGHAAVVAEIDRVLADSGLFIAGNYFDGLSIEDCVNRSVREVGRLCGGNLHRPILDN